MTLGEAPDEVDDRVRTVIGIWENDRPIPVGVIRGEHDVFGGDDTHFEEGVWATTVEFTGDDDDDGEAAAVRQMSAGEG